MIEFIRMYNRILGRRSELPTLAGLYALSGVFQAAALVLVYPLMIALIGNEDTQGVMAFHLADATPWFIAIVACGLASLLTIPVGWWGYKISCRGMTAAQERIGKKLVRLPLGWFDNNAAARVTSAAISSTNDISHLAPVVMPSLVQYAVSSLLLLIAMFFIDWRVALLLAVFLPVLWLIDQWIDRVSAVVSRKEKNSAELVSARTLEFASLQPLLRAAGGDRGMDRMGEALDGDYKATSDALSKKAIPAGVFMEVLSVGVVGALLLAAWLWSRGDLGAAAFITLAMLCIRFYQPVALLPIYKGQFVSDVESVRKIGDIVFTEPLPEPASGQEKVPSNNAISVSDVHFGYVAGAPVLNGISLEMPERSITALVGPSGCGKSTLLRLIARFWDVNSGEIAIDGADVRDITTSELMSRVAMVFQDVYLFDDTIEENVRLGNPAAGGAQIREAARRARLDEIIERLPDGWQTRVGEGGRQLSGGERQRVAIARAFLKDSPILLLDEVTASLDGANEAAITRSIRELSQGRTVVMIAHRLSTVVGADQIVVLGAEGIIEDRGTHEELKARSGTYASFLEAQAAGAAWTLTEG